MTSTNPTARSNPAALRAARRRTTPSVLALVLTAVFFGGNAQAAKLKVMKTGLGTGTVTSLPAGIDCGADCDQTFTTTVTVTLTAAAAPGSTFLRWEGDGTGTAPTTAVTVDVDRSVRAVFGLAAAIPELTDFTPTGIQAYLAANPAVDTPGKFVSALPVEFKRNWILMTRSESLQTGTARFPRILLPSADARFVFTIGLAEHGSYPGSHPSAIEYMQWDGADKNFRFHEIVLAPIPEKGNVVTQSNGTVSGKFPARARGVTIDDVKCSKCHSTRNVVNASPFPGTTGVTPNTIKAKNKPNWDAYDSWGGMLPFNRDRIYQGSVEAAAFRKLLNPWTWQANETVRSVIEQLELQPPGIPAGDSITRIAGGANDGHVVFAFDGAASPVLTEPVPTSMDPPAPSSYAFNGAPGTGATSSVVRGGQFVTLRHSLNPGGTGVAIEGRGVDFFDRLGGLDGTLNQQRIADELISHRHATGGVPIDVRPVALAIARGWIVRSGTTVTKAPFLTTAPALTVDLSFFDGRNGLNIQQLADDTRSRAVPGAVPAEDIRSESLPRRKADIQKLNLNRTGDIYLSSSDPANGLIAEYGGATSMGTDTSLARIRQEVFRRPVDLGDPDATVVGGIAVDRELYSQNTEPVALFRYFLEPLGVSVDKWSMNVRGRSRAYNFADVFGTYLNRITGDLKASLLADPVPGLTNPDDPNQVIAAVNSTLALLPPVNATPNFTDVQRIFNKSCIECHGGLNYPPYFTYGSYLDLSEDEEPPTTSPPMPSPRLARSHRIASEFTTVDPATSPLYRKITAPNEACPDFANGVMPCGGPELSKADKETIRRWIVGGRPSTDGDPHIKTVGGVNYDFQAVGEFVFLRDENLEVQVRQTAVETAGPLGPDGHTGLTTCVSVNGAVAIRVGRHRVTYQPNLEGRPNPEGMQLRVDGKLARLGDGGISLPSGGRIIRTIAPGGIQVNAPGGVVIVVTPGWWDHQQVWYLNVDTRHVRATQGLMGSIAPGNWLPALPDGSWLGPMPADLDRRHEVLYKTFADAWRVTDATTLFDYAPGTSTKAFTMKAWPGRSSPDGCKLPPDRRPTPHKPPQKPLTLEEATRLSADIVDPDRRANCIKDVMVTGERGFVKTYQFADRIARNATPSAPVLLGPPEDKPVLLATDIFRWKKSTDADGDPVTYRYYVWPVNEGPNNNKAAPVPKLNPRAPWTAIKPMAAPLRPGGSYFWKVIADDGKGGITESETRRFEVAPRKTRRAAPR